jgi:hypothetical protein
MNTTKMRFDGITQEEDAIAVFLIGYAMKEIAKTLQLQQKISLLLFQIKPKKGAGRK